MSDDTAVGMGVLELLCTKEHCVAQLIKRQALRPTYISVPGHAEAEWPREEDNGRTAAYCLDCAKWFSTRSFDLARSMVVLTADRSRHEGSYPLSEWVQI
jgi:hypothetical protein